MPSLREEKTAAAPASSFLLCSEETDKEPTHSCYVSSSSSSSSSSSLSLFRLSRSGKSARNFFGCQLSQKWIVTLNPNVLYRGLFRDLLAKVAKEREKEKESFDRPSETRLVSRARTERERERERERIRKARRLLSKRDIQHARFG